MSLRYPEKAEWLEADGLGGFASGTVCGVRTRRYHALLLAATDPPAGRLVLVNGFDAWVVTPEGRYPITSHRYTPDVVFPDGAARIESFQPSPWPRWVFEVGGRRLVQEIFARRGSPLVAVTWRLAERERGVTLELRPLLSGRDYHALHRENDRLRFHADESGERVVWRPYDALPPILSVANATSYRHEPVWYRGFLYSAERERGLDCVEDLASPGVFEWDLSHPREDAVWILTVEEAAEIVPAASRAVERVADLRAAERRRRTAIGLRERGVEAYLVRRGKGRTIVAGYPWFVDWGRDAFIALRGLCLATGRLEEARDVLVDWSAAIVDGIVPNRFAEHRAVPELNAADASLWFVIAVYELLAASTDSPAALSGRERERLREAVEGILEAYARGTRHGIRADRDGLLAAGQPGLQLTWMDARVGGEPVTPRTGKPVELQALWLNALHLAVSAGGTRWRERLARGAESFRERFWNPGTGHLNDVVDVDHAPGTADPTLRPNQVLAVGGLPLALVEGDRARAIVDAVEERLLTPLGLRTLDPRDPRYTHRYEGGVAERDAAYHQGPAWPWLLGPFVEAWVRTRDETAEAKREARRRFLDPLLRQLETRGMGHLPELADGEPPHRPRGCPFQAWSLGEALRLDRVVLAER